MKAVCAVEEGCSNWRGDSNSRWDDRETDKQTHKKSSSRRHYRPDVLPQCRIPIKKRKTFFISPFNMTGGKSVSDKPSFMVSFPVAEWDHSHHCNVRTDYKPIRMVHRAISPQVRGCRLKLFTRTQFASRSLRIYFHAPHTSL